MNAPCFPAAAVVPLIVVVFLFGAAFGVLAWAGLVSWLRGDES